MHILVDINGVLRGPKDEPISTGIIMAGTLSVYNQITFMSDLPPAQLQQWLDVNKIVDYDKLIDRSAYLEGDELAHRQIKLARSRGQVDLFITNDPSLWAYAFDLGIPSMMFGVPSYTRPEFRPDAPSKKRSWTDIEEAIKKQNALRTNDVRLSRGDGVSFE